MKYEISNTISNHKYDGWEISHKRPFKRGVPCFLYEMSIQGIPNPPPFSPGEWKFKVFYGVDEVIVTYDGIYNAFLDAICFFNSLHSKDEVEEVFRLWVKADNQSLYF